MRPLPRIQRAVRRGPPFDAVPLPRLRQALFRARRQRDGRHQARLPHPGRRPVPADHRHQGRLEPEAAPRPGRQPEVGPGTWRTASARAGSGIRALFAGPLEVDETDVGGKERNKHESKQARATNAVVARPLPGSTKGDLQGFVRGRVAPGAQVRSDEAAAYAGREQFPHEAVRHIRRRVRARGSAYERQRVVWVPVQARPLRNLSADERPASRPLPHGVRGTVQRTATATRRNRCGAWRGGLVGQRLTYRQLTGQAAGRGLSGARRAARSGPLRAHSARSMRFTLGARVAPDPE